MTEEAQIPKISDERLDELTDRIRPIVCKHIIFGRRKFPEQSFKKECSKRYIELDNPRMPSFLWNPTPIKNVTELEATESITTFHELSSSLLFQPTTAEVVAQIPEELLDKAVAFEIIETPFNVNDGGKIEVEIKNGLHVATTRLYKRE